MTHTPGTIELRVEPPFAWVSLNRPQVRNAFNGHMIGELTAIYGELSARDDLRAVVLQGNGRSFCAGADIDWMRSSLEFSTEENVADARRMAAMFDAIDRAPMATVAAVHGAVLGGGMGLVAASDIVIAAEDTVFGFTETKLGIVPGVISSLVVRKIGAGWARAFFLTGERFSADTARLVGLVHHICPAGEVEATLDRVLGELRSAGPVAIRDAKRLVRGVAARDPENARQYAASAIARARTSPEGQEGLRAFLEKRAPEWRG